VPQEQVQVQNATQVQVQEQEIEHSCMGEFRDMGNPTVTIEQ
jgi:hypothetical protein